MKFTVKFLQIYMCVVVLGFSWGCRHEGASALQALTSYQELYEGVVKDMAVNHPVVVVLDQKSHRATLISRGVVGSSWVYFSKQALKPGIYNIDKLEYCPLWRPDQIIQPKSKQRLRVGDAGYEKWVEENPQLYGACGAENPLGAFMLGFHGEYALHGTSLSLDRRWRDLKIGAHQKVVAPFTFITNPSSKIKKLFHDVMFVLGLKDFSHKVLDDQWKLRSERKPHSISLKGANAGKVKVIIGSFEKTYPQGCVMSRFEAGDCLEL